MARPIVFRAIKRNRIDQLGENDSSVAGHKAPTHAAVHAMQSADVPRKAVRSRVKRPEASRPSKRTSVRQNRSA
jgi:hypothetical protein